MSFKYAGFTVMMPEFTVQESAALLKELGYDGVEWRVHSVPSESSRADFWGGNKATIGIDTIEDTAASIKQLCDDSGLEILGLGTYLSYKMLDEIERCMVAAKTMGCQSIRISTPKYDGSENYNDLLDAAIDGFAKVETLAQKYGVRANIELHNGCITSSASAAYRLVSEFDPDSFGVILDPGNMIYEGHENWQMAMELLGPYLAHVHVKNAAWVQCDTKDDVKNWKSKIVSVKEGIVSWKDILTALNNVGYTGWLSVEDFAPGDTKSKLAQDLQYLKSIEAELGA